MQWFWNLKEKTQQRLVLAVVVLVVFGVFAGSLFFKTETIDEPPVEIVLGGADTNDTWCDTDWTYRRPLTFDASTTTSDISEYPMLVMFNSSRISYANTDNSGDDIRFYDNGCNILEYELENWNESGTSTAWVHIPTLDGATTTQFMYVYYGNAGASASASTTAPWDDNFGLVHHPNQVAGFNDSSNYGNDADANTNLATSTTGRIGSAWEGDGNSANNNRVEIPDSSTLDGMEDLTIEAWIRPDTNGQANYGRFFSKDDGNPWKFSMYNASDCNGVEFTINGLSSNSTNAGISCNSWHYIVGTYDGDNGSSNSVKTLYVDGVQIDSDTFVVQNVNDDAVDVRIGARENNEREFDGEIDELRLSNVVRSTDYIKLNYETAFDTVLTYGSEEEYTPPAVEENNYQSEIWFE